MSFIILAKDTLLEPNVVNTQLRLNMVPPTRLNEIQKESFLEYSVEKRGNNFPCYGLYDKLKKLQAVCILR
jgi:hypothetical protein